MLDEGMGSQCFMETQFLFGKMKQSGDGWWRWLYNNVNVLIPSEHCN